LSISQTQISIVSRIDLGLNAAGGKSAASNDFLLTGATTGRARYGMD
jgi:hypothetical protein